MKSLNSYIRREDLESEPGVIDWEKVRALTVNSYLEYIEDCVEMGGYQIPMIARDQMEDVMFLTVCDTISATEGRKPDLDEIDEYMKSPENVEALRNWTYICSHATKENWPETVRRFREELNVPEDIPLKNEERIRAEMEKAIRERTWTYKELGAGDEDET